MENNHSYMLDSDGTFIIFDRPIESESKKIIFEGKCWAKRAIELFKKDDDIFENFLEKIKTKIKFANYEDTHFNIVLGSIIQALNIPVSFFESSLINPKTVKKESLLAIIEKTKKNLPTDLRLRLEVLL